MGTLYVDTLEPQSGTSLAVGESGQNTVIGGNTIKLNTLKDAGANTLFVSDGSGTLSSVNAGFGSDMTMISSQTVDDGASISFTSGISSTYGSYIFKFYNIHNNTNLVTFGWQCNATDSTSYDETITSTYFRAYNVLVGGQNVGYEGGSDQAQGTGIQPISQVNSMSSAATDNLDGELQLFNPASTVYAKLFYSRTEVGEVGVSVDSYTSGYVNTTTAIDDIKFYCSSGTFDGTIKMFGMK